MGFQITDDHIHPGLLQFSCCFEHRIGFSYSGSIPKKDFQLSPILFFLFPFHFFQNGIRIRPFLLHFFVPLSHVMRNQAGGVLLPRPSLFLMKFPPASG